MIALLPLLRIPNRSDFFSERTVHWLHPMHFLQANRAENNLAEHGGKVDTDAQCTTYVKDTRCKNVLPEKSDQLEGKR